MIIELFHVFVCIIYSLVFSVHCHRFMFSRSEIEEVNGFGVFLFIN